MKKISSVLAAAAFAGLVVLPMQSANAFWGGGGPWSNSGYGGGPWNAMTDMWGGGDLNFNAKSYGHANGYGYGNPYYGYNSYGYPGGYGYGYPGGYGAPYGYGAPVAPAAPAAPAAQ